MSAKDRKKDLLHNEHSLGSHWTALDSSSSITIMLFVFAAMLPLYLILFRPTAVTAALCTATRTIYTEPDFDELESLGELCVQSQQLFDLLADAQHCFYDIEAGVLGHTEYSLNMFSRQPYVSNGYIGARISTLGQGFSYDQINVHSTVQTEDVLSNGWPLFNKRHTGAFAAGFFSLQAKLPSTNFPELYENGYDSVISTIPYWAQMDIELEDSEGVHVLNPMTVDRSEITNYHQNMSIENGLVSTKFVWRNKLEVEFDLFAHKQVLPLAVMTVSIRPLKETLYVKVRDSLNFTTSQRTTLENAGYDEEGIYMVVHPENVPTSAAAVYTSWDAEGSRKKRPNPYAVTNELSLELPPTHITTINKYIGIVASELQGDNNTSFAGSELEHAIQIVQFAKASGRDELFKNHNSEWCSQFTDTNILIPSNELLTLAARASLFHLLSNTNVNSRGLTSALGTAGLSSDSYGGMVFWDTDLWIIPGILPFAPKVAKAVADYRNYTHPQAMANAKQYGFDGAAYPWTSARFGNCTSTGPCVDYEYHINVDVALSSWALYLAGEDEEYLRYTTWPLLKDAADFLTDYTVFNETVGMYVTLNLTDPDEYANHVDNGAFTNAGIDSTLKVAMFVANHLGEDIPQKWLDVKDNIYIPVSSHGITLEYSHMNASVSIKQADVVMLTYPLEYQLDTEEQRESAIQDLLYYSLRQSDTGPAMTFPIFTIASRRLFSYGCSSQSYLQKSVLPYIRSPFAQFSEQSDDNVLTNGGTHPAFPFLTAHGGYLQAVIYGVLGLRYAMRIDPETLQIEKFLKFDPVRPLALPGGIEVKGFKYLTQMLDVVLTDDEGIIAHRGTEPVHVEVNQRNRLSGNYTLYPGQVLRVPAYEPPLNVPGSVTECQVIANLTRGMPGEVALSAIDGNNYTYWQAYDKGLSRLFIDITEPRQLEDGVVVWGQRPAKHFSLWASDESNMLYEQMVEHMDDMNFVKVVDNLTVEVSVPFDPRYTQEVKLSPNNETRFQIDAEFQGLKARFLMVEISGTLDEEGEEGATVNEVIIFAKD